MSDNGNGAVRDIRTLDLDLDNLEPIEIPFPYKGKNYVLREPTGGAAVAFRNEIVKRTKMGPDGKPMAFDGIAETEPFLVSKCLVEKFEKNGTEQERAVPSEIVKSFPNRLLKALFDKAKELGQIDEDADTEESLLKQRAEIDRKLEKIRKNKAKAGGGEDAATPEGNADASHDFTTDG